MVLNIYYKIKSGGNFFYALKNSKKQNERKWYKQTGVCIKEFVVLMRKQL